jgi:hypothetical protein
VEGGGRRLLLWLGVGGETLAHGNCGLNLNFWVYNSDANVR